MEFMPEQKRAIFLKNKNILVSAAAGSGKTTILVERIIQTILNKENNVNIDNLLVVTFTKMAASEMKERVYKALLKNIKLNPKNNYLKKQIALMDKSYITTIDSFCYNILKKHFKEADIDPNFKIADNTELEILKTDAINAFLDELYENKNQNFLNLLFASSYKIDDSSFIETFLSIYNQVQNIPFFKEWLINVKNSFNISTKEQFFETEIFLKYVEYSKKCIQNAKEIAIVYKNLFLFALGENETLPEFVDKDIELCNTLILAIENKRYNLFVDSLSNLKFSKLSLTKLKDFEKIKEKIKFLRDNFKKLITSFADVFFDASIADIIFNQQNIYPLIKTFCDLMLEFDEYFLNIKKQKNVFSFSDISHFCINILVDKKTFEPTAIAKQYQSIFSEIIIDEYQDSNSIQEIILKAISKSNNRFMVGDIKQCIYKFRQANPKIFIEKYINYEKKDEQNERIDLNKNFRSNEPVVDSINFIFKQLMSIDLGDVEYDESASLNFAANYPTNLSEKCELNIIDFTEIEPNDETDSILQELNEMKMAELEANFIIKRINKLMYEEKTKIYNKETNKYEPIKFRDIVILLRSTKNTAEILAKILTQNSIPAFSKTSNGFFDFIEVVTVLNILKIIDNPLQDLPLIAVLHSPIFYFSADELLEIKLSTQKKYFYHSIMDFIKLESNKELINKINKFLSHLLKWQDLVNFLNVKELIEYILNDTNYYNYVGLLKNGKIRQANLFSLLEKALNFENTNLSGLFSFINYIDKVKKGYSEGDANILSEDENLVRIMSIHKSKGLEFPIVFVSMLGKRFNQADLKDRIFFDEQLGLAPSFIKTIDKDLINSISEFEFDKLLPKYSFDSFNKYVIKQKIKIESFSEEMRILYVALTRAKEKLILIGSTKNVEKQMEKWQNIIILNVKKIVPDILIQNSNSFLDWIATALIKHKKDIFLNEDAMSLDIFDTSKWNVNIINRQDLILENSKNEDNIKNNFYIIKQLDTDRDFSGFKDEIYKKLSWIYFNKLEQNIPVRKNISDIKYNYQAEILGLNSFEKPSPNFNLPNFYKTQETSVTSMKKGSIYHKILEHIDFDIFSLEQLNIFFKSLINKNILNKDDLSLIDFDKILTFLNSNLVKRIRKAKLIKRECPFVLGLSPYEVFYLEKYKNLESTILINGIIDLYFEEDGEIVLVDYKTDKVKNNIKQIIERYKIQLEIYKKALEQNTGLKVKQVLIYLLDVNKEVDVLNKY